MTEFVQLALGSQYPARLPGTEGAHADFLRQSGNTLYVLMPGIDKREQKSLKRGQIRCGMLADGPDILLLWQFSDEKGRPVLTLDSPFDARKIPDRKLHNITNDQQRLAINLIAVDTQTNIIKALRLVTMPPTLTTELLSAVQTQIASGTNGTMMVEWMASDPTELARATSMALIGV
jgi:hypothetical protein